MKEQYHWRMKDCEEAGMNIYLCYFKDVIYGSVEESLSHHLSKQRQERISKLYHDIDKVLCLYSDLIVRKHLIEKFNCNANKIIFTYNKYGKPYLLEPSDLFFNISHTKNAILCGFSNREIGVDIEKISEPPYEIMNRYFTKEESKYIDFALESEKKEAFYKIWTKKESYSKWYGTGLNLGLMNTNVLHNIEPTCFYTDKIGQYCFSICSAEKMDDLFVEIVSLDMIKDTFFTIYG